MVKTLLSGLLLSIEKMIIANVVVKLKFLSTLKSIWACFMKNLKYERRRIFRVVLALMCTREKD